MITIAPVRGRRFPPEPRPPQIRVGSKVVRARPTGGRGSGVGGEQVRGLRNPDVRAATWAGPQLPRAGARPDELSPRSGARGQGPPSSDPGPRRGWPAVLDAAVGGRFCRGCAGRESLGNFSGRIFAVLRAR